jgi:hypothetical protein
MFEFLFDCDCGESAAWADRLPQTNDPAGQRKQILLRYAGIGARYGLACALFKIGVTAAARSIFEIFDRGLRWSAPIAAAARSDGAMGRFSRIRDPTAQALSTDGRTDNLRQ